MALTPEQLKERVNYLGASEAAAVIGMSRWSSPLQVWAEKTGLLPPPDLSDNLAVQLGDELEDFVARKFTRETGKKVQRVKETLYHPKYPFIACHLDRRIVGENAILQCKTCSAWKAKEWEGEEIPAEYIIQEIHELAVSGKDRAEIAVLIGNSDFKMKTIWRDDKAISDLIAREVHFWKTFVEPKVMPEATGRDRDTLTALFPQAEQGKEIGLGEDARAICDALEALQRDYSGLGMNIEEHKNRLRALLGDADVGVAGVWRIRWQNTKASEYMVKRPAGRTLRISKKEEEQNG